MGGGSEFMVGDRRRLPPELEEARARIVGLGESYGLDFFETAFVMCRYDEINMLAAYGGFPLRYPHWRFGMEYLQMAKGYEWGLQKIYEMVINTDPSYAYLLDNNTFMDQKLVMAHVLGHVDFFKNNLWFAPTNRKMLDQMANHGTRIRRYIDRVGHSKVEAWIDVCLSVDNLIDPHRPHIVRERDGVALPDGVPLGVHKLPARGYMDKYINPPEFLAEQRRKQEIERDRQARFPEDPQLDVLLFLLRHGQMKDWQADVLSIIREEAYYFAPQGQTKIMNEGWATYWHTHMMTHDILTSAEVVDYADHHAGTVATRPGQFNPYKIGVELWRNIEERWDRGQFGKAWMDCTDHRQRKSWDTGVMLGRQKIFEARRTHNDVTFIDEFLSEDFVRQHGIFTWEFDKRRNEYVISSTDFKAVKEKLLFMLTNRGQPRMQVIDGNHGNRGELCLEHRWDGIDIQLDWAQRTLSNLALIWGRPVHLETVVDGKPIVLHHDGEEFSQEARKAQ
jgi:stage V sporulation protein R